MINPCINFDILMYVTTLIDLVQTFTLQSICDFSEWVTRKDNDWTWVRKEFQYCFYKGFKVQLWWEISRLVSTRNKTRRFNVCQRNPYFGLTKDEKLIKTFIGRITKLGILGSEESLLSKIQPQQNTIIFFCVGSYWHKIRG